MSNFGLKAYSSSFRTDKPTEPQILIDSELQHMHYAGQATLTASDTNMPDFAPYTGANSTLDGRVIHTYTYATDGVPLVFVRPTNYNLWHAVIQQAYDNVNKLWTIRVIQSGTVSSPPEIHVFLAPTYLATPTSNYGLTLYGSVPLYGPSAEKLYTVSRKRVLEPSFTTEATTIAASALVTTSTTPLAIAGSSVTLFGQDAQPTATGLGDVWVDSGAHPLGLYPIPIAPIEPTYLDAVEELLTIAGFDAYIINNGYPNGFRSGYNTYHFGREALQVPFQWTHYQYPDFEDGRMLTLGQVCYDYWGPMWEFTTPVGSKLQICTPYFDYQKNDGDGFWTHVTPDQFCTDPHFAGLTPNINLSWMDGNLILFDKYYGYYFTDWQTRNNAQTAANTILANTYENELTMYNALAVGYNAHYAGFSNAVDVYRWGKADYGKNADGSYIISGVDKWVKSIDAPADTQVQRALSGNPLVQYSVPKPPIPTYTGAAPIAPTMVEGGSYAGWTALANSLGYGDMSGSYQLPGNWNSVDNVLKYLLFGYDNNLRYKNSPLSYDWHSYWHSGNYFSYSSGSGEYAIRNNNPAGLLNSLQNGLGAYRAGEHVNLNTFAQYWGFSGFVDYWNNLGTTSKSRDYEWVAQIKNPLTAHITANNAAWVQYNQDAIDYAYANGGYAAAVAAWEVNRAAYIATVVASQVVTTTSPQTINPNLIAAFYHGFEYTYDWNLFSGIPASTADLLTFDSRLSPMAVVDGGTLIPPATPLAIGQPGESGVIGSIYFEDGVKRWNQNTMAPWGGTSSPGNTPNDFDFRSYNHHVSAPLTTVVPYTNLMFVAPSIAQAVQQRSIRGYKEDTSYFYYYSPPFTYTKTLDHIQQHFSTAAWWVMYLNAFRFQVGEFQAGWATYDSGYSFDSRWDDGGVFGGGGGNKSFGSTPYDPKIINRIDNLYIVTDVTRYV